MRKIILFTILSLWIWHLNGQINNDLAIANTLVEKGDLTSAIDKYNEVIANGDISAEVYFNLGNTYLQIDSLASSILYYEKALRLDPVDQDILNNLEIARGKVEDQVTVLPEFFLITIWKKTCLIMAANSWAILSIIISLVLLTLYYFFAYRGLKLRFKVKVAIVGALMLCLLLSILAGYSRKYMDTHKTSAIVFVETFMKSGPDSRSDDLKLMHPGYKVFLLDELNGWVKVRTEDREEGWIEPDNLKVI